MPVIVTRRTARAAGVKRYFTGKPCKYGHVAERFTSTGNCIACEGAPARKSYKKDWESENKVGIAERRKARHLADPKKYKAVWDTWYLANADAVIARAADWNRQNPDKVWAARHPEENAAKVAAWRKANPEKKNAIERNRRARIKDIGGVHSADDIAWLFEKQSGRCAHSWCRRSLKDSYHVDHRMPLALKGSNDRRNLQLLCPPCNVRKRAKHPIAFAQQHGMLL